MGLVSGNLQSEDLNDGWIEVLRIESGKYLIRVYRHHPALSNEWFATVYGSWKSEHPILCDTHACEGGIFSAIEMLRDLGLTNQEIIDSMCKIDTDVLK